MTKTQSIHSLISLKGKRALITGAGAGIGNAIAHRFAEAQADLDLIDIDQENLAKTQKELEKYGVEIKTYPVDLSKKENIDDLWKQLSPQAPDILVNNAGIYPFKDFLDVNENFYKRVIETNLDSVFWMCHHMIGKRIKKGGVVINVGSIEAILPFKEDLAHYSMSKAGVIALTRALAKEHGKDGFRINAILPGGIITQGTLNAAKNIFRLNFKLLKSGFEFKQRLPIGRLGKPDEIARMTLTLASDLASYVHGATIPIDGGFLAA